MHPSPATHPASSTSPSPSALLSVSSVSSVSSVVNHSPACDEDPDPRIRTRREEAFTLYCHGYRSPAIASLLGVPERTVRAWIAATLQASAEESRTRRDQQLRLAIESQRAIVQAAWHAFDRAARAERLTLEHLQNAVPLNVDADDDAIAFDSHPYSGYAGPPSPPHVGARHVAPGRGMRLPHLPTIGARYLQIVLHAQREIARLSGLYDLPDSFFDPNAGRPMQIVIRKHPHLPPDQLLAWAAFREQWDAAHPHDPIPPEDLVFPPDGAPHHDYAIPDPDDPDDDGLSADHPDLDAASFDTPEPGGTYHNDGSVADAAHDTDSPPPDPVPTAAPQPAQAGFVANRPIGADSSAGPPTDPCGRGADSSAGLLAGARESAAETASLSPSSPAAADPAITNPGATPSEVVHPGSPIPPALLPRFRRRSGPLPHPTGHPAPRAVLPLAPRV